MQHPAIFYKYAPASTVQIVLQSSRLRWSSPLIFNDPAEFQRMPRFEPTLREAYFVLPGVIVAAVQGHLPIRREDLSPQSKLVFDWVRDALERGVTPKQIRLALSVDAPEADSEVAEGLGNVIAELDLSDARVLCVTTEADNDAMWNVYGDSHQGCVMAFRHLPERLTPLMAARPVAYSAEPPIVGSGVDFLLHGDHGDLAAKTVNAICYTKRDSWSYEREWRAMIIRREQEKYGDYLFHVDELESLTFGHRTPTEAREQLSDLVSAQYPQAKIYQMETRAGALARVHLK